MHILRHRRKQAIGIWYFPFYPNLCVLETGSLLKALKLHECLATGFYLALTDACPMQFSGSIDLVKIIFLVKSLDYIKQEDHIQRLFASEVFGLTLIWLLIPKQSS